jgi:hypothetical protein
MSASSFVERLIDVKVDLAQDTGTNQPTTFTNGATSATFSGFRTSVRIQNSGGLTGSQAQVDIWGLAPTWMNELSTLGMVIQLVPRNVLTITAGNAVDGMTTIFVGNIIQAIPDYNAQPKVPLRFECMATGAAQVAPAASSSFTPGGTDVATVMQQLATKAGWGFENNSVSVQIAAPYLWGSVWSQVRQLADAANINAEVLGGVLAIWPRYGTRSAGGDADIPLIAPDPDGQMIGFPSFTPSGIMVKNIFDPRVVQGGAIKVQSSIFTDQSLKRIDATSSIWTVGKLDLALDSKVPKGEWMQMIYAYNPRYPQPLPPSTSS